MNNDEHISNDASRRADEIYFAAQAIESEDERNAFMEDACVGDDGLRREMDKLFAWQGQADQLFETIGPTTLSVVDLSKSLMDGAGVEGDAGSPLPDDGEVGKQIGPYKLLKRIGEGGGGNVYLAEQTKPVRRRVAFKIIKLGLDTKSVIARFEAERQALAMMEHPNIAHVLNAGATETGRPFFVMELVNGISITTYCDENKLDIHQRLELFIQVCHAIQHAHQKGIIHRDIKPSNVLITLHDRTPMPKVIDFGIAKATRRDLLTDETFHTSFEPFIGTPAYMSPEQAQMGGVDLDTRSDIYSLGVLLYELLTGKQPFEQKELIKSGLDEMRRTLRDVDPLRPSSRLAALSAEERARIVDCRQCPASQLLALLEGDLDWIVMKALDKDRDLRYRSADGMADDIQRYLDHEPVLARPPSRLYRLRKMVRRNKPVFAAGTAIVVILLMSASVSTWLLIKERMARQRALLAEQEKGELQSVLRVNVETQQQLAKATRLFQQGRMEDADAILDGISSPGSAPGTATMFREIGDWHALNARWKKAKDRFAALAEINEIQGLDTTMDDIRSAALLVEQGYLDDYERFRESLIARYAGTENPMMAQRIIRACLLIPANNQLMNALGQFGQVTEKAILEASTDQDRQAMGWHDYAMSMLAYRQGDYEATLDWCRRASVGGFPTRDLSIQLIQSLVMKQQGLDDEAQTLLSETRLAIEAFYSSKPSNSRVWQGFWFDQAFIRIHQSEAEALIETQTESSY